MRKLLVNFLTSNTGGVINFKKDVLKYIDENSINFDFDIYCLVSAEAKAQIGPLRTVKYCSGMEVPVSPAEKISFYEKDLQKLVTSHGFDVLLNFGDIPARVSAKQVFYFDWPYAVYNDIELWTRMSFSELVSKIFKRTYFRLAGGRPDYYIVQTRTMKKRLSAKIKNKPISVIDVGFNDAEFRDLQTVESAFKPQIKPSLMYPTVMYPHKNVEILLPVAKYLKAKNLPVEFQLTFSERCGAKEARFVHASKKLGLSDYFEFLGRLPRGQLLKQLKSSTAIIMPTLIETYGLPYLEAQLLGKVMLTSDRDFAKELCAGSAIYFDPLNPVDISEKIIEHLWSGKKMLAYEAAIVDVREKRLSWRESTSRLLEITGLV